MKMRTVFQESIRKWKARKNTNISLEYKYAPVYENASEKFNHNLGKAAKNCHFEK